MLKRVIAVIVVLSLSLPFFCLSGYAIDYCSGNSIDDGWNVSIGLMHSDSENSNFTWTTLAPLLLNDGGTSYQYLKDSNGKGVVASNWSINRIRYNFSTGDTLFAANTKYKFYMDATLQMCRNSTSTPTKWNIPVSNYSGNLSFVFRKIDGSAVYADFDGVIYPQAMGFIINGTVSFSSENAGNFYLDIFLDPAFNAPATQYAAFPYTSIDISDWILGTSGSPSSVDAVNDYITAAADQISAEIGIAAADIKAVLMQIYRYMTGDQTAILNAIKNNGTLVYQLLQNNMLPAIINGFSSLEGVVEDGFASTALEIQAQTAQLILTLTNAFNHLEGVIGAESDDIQAAIAAQTEAILAYLEDSFSAANNPALSAGAQEGSIALEGNEAIEGELQESLDNNVGNIDFNSYALPAGILNAVLWIGNTFTGFYNELGDMQIVITLPLVVGLILLMIGRGSRAIISASMRGSRRDSDA